MTFSSNTLLTLDEMTVNAQYILNYLTNPINVTPIWTKEAVCGMLGNMQKESTINPGVWQGLDDSNPANGFGLVQWTPSTNYTDWADTNGWSHDSMDGQLARILYEVANSLQWIATFNYNYTFAEYTQKTDAASVLADAFVKNYERPADPNNVQDRWDNALYWYSHLTVGGSVNPKPKLTLQYIQLKLVGAL